MVLITIPANSRTQEKEKDLKDGIRNKTDIVINVSNQHN